MELPEAVKRKHAQSSKPRENKKSYGKSNDLRPEIASQRTEEEHWEGDTVVGKRAGKEAVVFSLLEKKTETYIAFLIPGKTSEAVMAAMKMLKAEYGDRFAQVFKTITVDNGSEFSDFAQRESWGTEVFFAHPYTSVGTGTERTSQWVIPSVRSQGGIHGELLSRIHSVGSG